MVVEQNIFFFSFKLKYFRLVFFPLVMAEITAEIYELRKFTFGLLLGVGPTVVGPQSTLRH